MTTTNETIRIAVVYDKDFPWPEDLVNYTIQMIQDPTDGWFDDIIFPDGTLIDWKYESASCEPNESPSAYWKIRSSWNETTEPPHGLIGARCSAASKELAVLSSVEGVPQVSPASSSAVFSDKKQYPYFSRLNAPDSDQGQAGALVALLRKFQWKRVGVVLTDEQYSRDLANFFQNLWREPDPTDGEPGSIAFPIEINLKNDTVDPDSVNQFLKDGRVTDPRINSRGILLIARDKHAFDILNMAHSSATNTSFPQETIWIGTDAWTARLPDSSKYAAFQTPTFQQGYIGLAPYQDRQAPIYIKYLERLNAMAMAHRGKLLFEEGDDPDYSAAMLVDSVVALTMALSKVDPSERSDGMKVTRTLRQLQFQGISGDVSFTPEGDRADMAYAIWNTQRMRKSTSFLFWNSTGIVSSPSPRQWQTNYTNTCFDAQCQLTTAPDDTYYVFPLPIWVVVVIPLIVLILLGVLVRYCRSSYRIKAISAMISTATEELTRLVRGRFEPPDHWKKKAKGLVEVSPLKDEYWEVARLLRESMPDAHISHLWRVQNHSLWAFYSSHKDRWSLIGTAHNEVKVWHGTSNVDPDVIYNDPQDGFIMQMAHIGWWGRGLYFASRSLYSDSYAYRPYGSNWKPTYGDRPQGGVDEREMFLVKLLVGNEVELPRDASLDMPPHMHGTSGPRYNTVTGVVKDDTSEDGTKVYVIYENGRAYPEYLIRYYRGNRDHRTPHGTREEAVYARRLRAEEGSTSSSSDGGGDVGNGGGDDVDDVETARVNGSINSHDDADVEIAQVNGGENVAASGTVCWEFFDNDGWNRYSDEHQAILEAAYPQRDHIRTVRLTTTFWTYEVDLVALVQTNLDHPDHTTREVQRLVTI